MIFLLLGMCPAQAADSQEKQLSELASEAYIYGYPLLIMHATMQKMTAPQTSGGENMVNRFSHIRTFPDHTFTDVVSPNADTLYSIAWLDLKDSPMLLSLPEMEDRYYVMQFLDAWTNDFISLGSRTTGNRPGIFLISGPGWRGEVPSGMVQVKSPTNMVWILGRTQTNGKEDYLAVNAIQDKYQIKPLTQVNSALVKADADDVSPLEKVEAMKASEFFGLLNQLMLDNPPVAADKPLLDKLAAISIAPGQSLDTAPTHILQALQNGHSAGLAKVVSLDPTSFGTISGGWSILPANVGNYGTDYLLRAFVARYGLGANLPADAVYPSIRTDASGQPLNGKSSYIIRFAANQLPPVKAFWSISMYDENQRFVENPVNRYAIGDRDQLVFDEDGGLTIYVQHSSPGADKEANWQPAPTGDFNMIMRLYWPKPAILDGSWPLPRVERVGE